MSDRRIVNEVVITPLFHSGNEASPQFSLTLFPDTGSPTHTANEHCISIAALLTQQGIQAQSYPFSPSGEPQRPMPFRYVVTTGDEAGIRQALHVLHDNGILTDKQLHKTTAALQQRHFRKHRKPEAETGYADGVEYIMESAGSYLRAHRLGDVIFDATEEAPLNVISINLGVPILPDQMQYAMMADAILSNAITEKMRGVEGLTFGMTEPDFRNQPRFEIRSADRGHLAQALTALHEQGLLEDTKYVRTLQALQDDLEGKINVTAEEPNFLLPHGKGMDTKLKIFLNERTPELFVPAYPIDPAASANGPLLDILQQAQRCGLIRHNQGQYLSRVDFKDTPGMDRLLDFASAIQPYAENPHNLVTVTQAYETLLQSLREMHGEDRGRIHGRLIRNSEGQVAGFEMTFDAATARVMNDNFHAAVRQQERQRLAPDSPAATPAVQRDRNAGVQQKKGARPDIS